jgi:hypothetical protein
MKDNLSVTVSGITWCDKGRVHIYHGNLEVFAQYEHSHWTATFIGDSHRPGRVRPHLWGIICALTFLVSS